MKAIVNRKLHYKLDYSILSIINGEEVMPQVWYKVQTVHFGGGKTKSRSVISLTECTVFGSYPWIISNTNSWTKYILNKSNLITFWKMHATIWLVFMNVEIKYIEFIKWYISYKGYYDV